jgi:predicted NUDIX family phosphoesterase
MTKTKEQAKFVGKDNEEVMVVKTTTLFPDGVWEGFKQLDQKKFLTFINKNSEYLKRGFTETDDNFQQIVAQIILKVGKKIFIHKVAQTGSESRLHDLWPIFLGGHINNTDRDISSAFDREFKEEINYKGKIVSKKFWGVVKLHDNPVNKVHVGLVWIYEGDSEEYVDTDDGGLADGHFADIKELISKENHMTYWSKLVLPDLIKLLSK